MHTRSASTLTTSGVWRRRRSRPRSTAGDKRRHKQQKRKQRNTYGRRAGEGLAQPAADAVTQHTACCAASVSRLCAVLQSLTACPSQRLRQLLNRGVTCKSGLQSRKWGLAKYNWQAR